MKFSDLNIHTPLLNALGDLGYTTPTTIQEKVFSVTMSGKDVLGIAQTGTGKTFAYLLPLLRQWQFTKDRFPQILVMVPTRELVVQVVREIEKLSAYMSLSVVGVYGGTNMKTQIAAVEEKTDVIVATPGRLLDLALHGSLRLKNIKKVVVDEVDEMFNLGFRTQLIRIFDLLPVKRQHLLFSATLSEDVERFISENFPDPVKIEAAPAGTPIEKVNQRLFEVPNFYTKINLLEKLLSDKSVFSKVLVFTTGKDLAEHVFGEIDIFFPGQLGIIHGSKEQNFRLNAVRQFRSGQHRVLIATDLISRGIDIEGVSHVINFDVPDLPEHYIHRIGRTGRADREGIALTFAAPAEIENVEAIEALMNRKILREPLPDDLEISTELTEAEKPKIRMRNVLVKEPKQEERGPAFHEKKEKNKKVNVKLSRGDKMKQKYGKPKTKSGKKLNDRRRK